MRAIQVDASLNLQPPAAFRLRLGDASQVRYRAQQDLCRITGHRPLNPGPKITSRPRLKRVEIFGAAGIVIGLEPYTAVPKNLGRPWSRICDHFPKRCT